MLGFGDDLWKEPVSQWTFWPVGDGRMAGPGGKDFFGKRECFRCETGIESQLTQGTGILSESGKWLDVFQLIGRRRDQFGGECVCFDNSSRARRFKSGRQYRKGGME